MKRTETINTIISDLEALERSGFSNAYAVRENIEFFKAIRTFPGYLNWLWTRAPKIDGTRLLELSDLPLPQWETVLHEQLTTMSKKNFPGMVTPLRKALVAEAKAGARVFIDLGCGGMEIVAQLISTLEQNALKVLVFGVDQSTVLNDIVKKNLMPLSDRAELLLVDQLDAVEVGRLRQRSADSAKHLVVLCKNNIFKLDDVFGFRPADVVFHSRFKHHLTPVQKQQLDALLPQIATVSIEFDEYKDMFLPIPQGIATWSMPPLMNGAVFSRLREISRRETKEDNHRVNSLQYFGLLGAYLKIKKY